VRDGANAVKNLADNLDKRFSNQMAVGVHVVAGFDGNGLYYAPDWRLTWGIYWDATPAVTAICGTYGTGNEDFIVVAAYMPHNNAMQMVLRGLWAGSGLGINGNIDLFITAIGSGKRA
jgi:hypothetical protein